MRAYLPQMSRYQREVFDLAQTIARGMQCLGNLPEDLTARQVRQQARLVLAALREHQDAVVDRFAELEKLLTGEDK
jgi:hypothetical protein